VAVNDRRYELSVLKQIPMTQHLVGAIIDRLKSQRFPPGNVLPHGVRSSGGQWSLQLFRMEDIMRNWIAHNFAQKPFRNQGMKTV